MKYQRMGGALVGPFGTEADLLLSARADSGEPMQIRLEGETVLLVYRYGRDVAWGEVFGYGCVDERQGGPERDAIANAKAILGVTS
jgi:hypothetical protein